MGRRNLITAFLLFCAIALGFWCYQSVGARSAGAGTVAQDERQQQHWGILMSWVRQNIADPEATIEEVKEQNHEDLSLVAFRVRERNALGGYTFQNFLAKIEGEEVDCVWDEEMVAAQASH